MTTIIVVAIVALVFFVAISVAVFMTWRQETRMRTDSIRGIEISLNEALVELSQKHPAPDPSADEFYQEHFQKRSGKLGGFKRNSSKHFRSDEVNGEHDPFGWADREPGIDVTVFRPSDISTKRSEAKTAMPEPIEPAEHEPIKEEPKAEPPIIQKMHEAGPGETKNEDRLSEKEKTDLSFIDIDDLFDLDEIMFEGVEHDRSKDYNTGRSGRKYTAEELESLIKE